MKEYGGYIPLESHGTEFYSEKCGEEKPFEVLALNAARNAIVAAIQDGSFEKIWLPVYTCESVYDAIRNAGISWETYHIDTQQKPIVGTMKENECILITNYFGIRGRSFYDEMCSMFQNIIFDNTQSFFEEPVIRANVYNIYSPRKFVGVPDGAYLITQAFYKKHDYEQDSSAGRGQYLLEAAEFGTNAAYQKYLDSEQNLSDSKIRKMSKLTHILLAGIDYESVQRKRKANYKTMYDLLSRVNELSFDYDETVCPMVYPLLLQSNGTEFRKYLIDNKIFIPQWWKWVLGSGNANLVEEKMSNFLYPLPIDQRYTSEDMQEIVRIIKDYKTVK